MTNSLLNNTELPSFSTIEIADIEPAISQLIERNKASIEELLAANTRYTADNLLGPIEELDDELSRVFSPVSHLNSVRNSDELREAYNACLPLLSAYGTWMGTPPPSWDDVAWLRERLRSDSPLVICHVGSTMAGPDPERDFDRV